MMSADPPENRESGQGKQAGHCDTDHPQPSGDQRGPLEVPSHQESVPCREAKTVSRGAIPTTAIQRSSSSSSFTPAASLVITTTASDGDVTTTAVTDTNAGDKCSVILTTDAIARVSSSVSTDSSSSTEVATVTKNPLGTTTAFTSSNTSQTFTTTLTTTSISTATATTHTTLTTSTTTSSFSHPSTSTTTTTTTFSRRKSPLSTLSSRSLTSSKARMGLHHPTVGVNGHALPRVAGENRDAPRNPSPLLATPSASPVRHRERLIGPVIARVATPPLRLAEAQREKELLSSVNQRLMSKPVKRKLWEVDHDKLGEEIETEYKQIVEADEKRFKERWEELGPEEILSAPRFYYSEVITTNKKDAAKSSTSSSSSTSGPSVPPTSSSSSATPVSTDDNSASQMSPESVSKPTGTDNKADAEKSSLTTDLPKKSVGSLEDLKSSGASSVVTAEKRGQAEVVTEAGLLSERQNLAGRKRQRTSDISSSPATSPSASISSSSLNLSTSSRSSSGVSSLESTPTQTITPVGSDTPAREAAPVERIAPTQETAAPSQRPTTRSCRQRRSSQRTVSGPPRKHLRM